MSPNFLLCLLHPQRRCLREKASQPAHAGWQVTRKHAFSSSLFPEQVSRTCHPTASTIIQRDCVCHSVTAMRTQSSGGTVDAIWWQPCVHNHQAELCMQFGDSHGTNWHTQRSPRTVYVNWWHMEPTKITKDCVCHLVTAEIHSHQEELCIFVNIP